MTSISNLINEAKVHFAGFEPTLISINITVAILAINFSFLAYQSSHYRQLQEGLSGRLLYCCLAVLFLGMTPASSLFFSREIAGVIGIVMLPIMAGLAIVLVSVAKKEATAQALIRRLSNERGWRKAFRRHGNAIRANEAKWKKLAWAKPQNMPTHEWAFAPKPPVPFHDPISRLGAVGRIAAKDSNGAAVALVSRTLLTALEICYQEVDSKEKPLPQATVDVVNSQLKQIAVAAEEADSTGNLSARLMDVCAEFLGDKAEEEIPSASLCFDVVNMIRSCGIRWLEKGNASIAVAPLVVIRLLCEKGLSSRDELVNEPFEKRISSLFGFHNLSRLPESIKVLGTAAIQNNNSNFLYRVFDAFGWLGCSAIKAENCQVASSCIRALAQLGREARTKELECHWDGCAARPEDHARERIEWIASWITQAPEDTRASWLAFCSQGLSRLSGHVTELTFSEANGKPSITESIGEAHKERFSSDAGYRELDYSDFGMLKDFELHGYMGEGMFIQSSPIPLVTRQFTDAEPDILPK